MAMMVAKMPPGRGLGTFAGSTAPPELVPEVMTPHYGDWYATSGAAIAENAPGDWMSPTPIPFLAVEVRDFELTQWRTGQDETANTYVIEIAL
jgi:CRISPR/Cas system CMR subunit Cmr6 (Cas7 group RAMP superfamily)